MQESESYKVRQIPDNFGNGINIAGMHFSGIFLVEGIVLAALFFVLTFLCLKSLGMCDIGEILGICLVFSGIALVVGVKGINDEPVTTFVKNLHAFNKGRRTAYYNPRIKLEAKSIKWEGLYENKDAIPKEKIMAAFNKYKEAAEKRQQAKAKEFEEANAFDQSNMFFEDDIGIIKKPSKYMTKEEAATYDKKKRKIMNFKITNLNEKQ